MKLTVKKGANVDEAIQCVANFLRDKYGEYNVLEKELSVYVHIKNGAGMSCTDNNGGFEVGINGEGMTLEEKNAKKAQETTMRQWEKYIKEAKERVRVDGNAVERAKNKLDGLKGKNTKEARNQKVKTKEAEKKLRESVDRLELILKLNSAYEEGIVNGIVVSLPTVIIRNNMTEGYRRYNGKMYEGVLVFKDIEGFTGYFKNNKLSTGSIKLKEDAEE